MQGRNEVYAVLIHSERAEAEIKEIDFSKADAVEGVVGHICAQDLNEQQNFWGTIVTDEAVFASGRVVHHGQVIAALLCSSLEIGKQAKDLVRVTYGDAEVNNPCKVYGLGEIAGKSGICALEKLPSFGGPQRLRRYLDDESVSVPGNEAEGTISIGGQQHFYLEPHNVLVVPIGEKNEYIVYVGNQMPDGVQGKLARALNIPKHKITIKTKRTGGAFGGKERYDYRSLKCGPKKPSKFPIPNNIYF